MRASIFLHKGKNIINKLEEYQAEFIALRRYFHQHPELSRQEFRTSDKIAQLLTSWGIPVERNIAGTGLVGLITKGKSKRMVGIRADMDALPIDETTNLPYASQTQTVMHACGHDGHMAMLLMAAKYLSLDADFDGQIALIFQPDEEDTAGAKRMIKEGLFDKYPVEAVFAMHNFPSAPTGTLLIKSGPQMAGTVGIKITVTGKGCHAAHPYKGIDPILIAAHIIVAAQSIVARTISPLESGVISIGSIHGGVAPNVIPQEVLLTGTLRYFDERVKATMETRLRELVTQTALAYGGSASIELTQGYIPTINHDAEAAACLKSAQKLFHPQWIQTDKAPSMGAEDFAFMLAAKKGAYVYIGNGDDTHGKTLHNPNFDFNDDNILIGACFWAQLALDLLEQ